MTLKLTPTLKKKTKNYNVLLYILHSIGARSIILLIVSYVSLSHHHLKPTFSLSLHLKLLFRNKCIKLTKIFLIIPNLLIFIQSFPNKQPSNWFEMSVLCFSQLGVFIGVNATFLAKSIDASSKVSILILRHEY